MGGFGVCLFLFFFGGGGAFFLSSKLTVQDQFTYSLGICADFAESCFLTAWFSLDLFHGRLSVWLAVCILFVCLLLGQCGM